MMYHCSLASGQQLYLENQAGQTRVTVATASAGQQQQASSSFQTGTWTAPPQVFRTATGAGVKIFAGQVETVIQIQAGQMQMGSSANLSGEPLPLSQTEAVPVQPMAPMQPMQPMQMGNMTMNMTPMTMRMGNMELRMPTTGTSQSAKFCTQCGTAAKPTDRFCSQCGHALSTEQ